MTSSSNCITSGPRTTANGAVVWIPERRLMFTGDIAFNGGTSFIVQGSLAGRIAACERLRELGAERIAPGHAAVRGPEALDGMLDNLRFLRHVAEDGYAACVSPHRGRQETDLGEFAKLDERERIVANLHAGRTRNCAASRRRHRCRSTASSRR